MEEPPSPNTPPQQLAQNRKPWVSKSYLIGISFIVSVSVIWAASSVLIQHIYTDTHNTFHSPFLVTYIGISLFTLWLPTQRIVRCIQQCCCTNTRNQHTANEYETIPFDNVYDDPGGMHHAATTSTSTNDAESNDINQVIHTSIGGGNDLNNDIAEPVAWTEYDHLHAAMYIAPVWFIANWSYNTSLIYTSITSSTVLASTGSLFTYIFAIVTKDEQINTMKFVGVLLGVLGSFITTLSDTTSTTTNSNSHTSNLATVATSNDDFIYHDTNNQSPSSSYTAASSVSILPMLGDILGVISAIGYGAYAVQTRIYCPKNESLYSMQTLLGYIGLCNCIVLSPFAVYLMLSGQSQLTLVIVGFLVMKGLFDNVLSDYLWLRAVILTNATTATVGLGLTIPLAFASDILLGKQSVLGTEQIIGAITVLVGFVLVNIGNNETDPPTGLTSSYTDTIETSERSNATRYSQVPPLDLDENKSQRGQEIVPLPSIHSVS